jgi:hypothetical protein
MPFSFCLVPFACCLALAGCRGPDLVTPDLRFRTNHLHELSEELWRGDFGALARDAVREEGTHTVAYSAGGQLRRLVLVPPADGGEGGGPLTLTLEPRDLADRPVPVSGSVSLWVYQVDTDGRKTPLGACELSPEQLSQSWQAGWARAGYTLTLPWKTPASARHLSVVARLKLLDGTCRNARSDVALRRPEPAWEPAAGVKEHRAGHRAEGSEVRQVQAVTDTTGRWQPASLEGAVRIRRPVPLGRE